ncbi:DUF3087 family protein [Thalassomonas actiniarum]|uniref:DUF3087 family protein n=1 Tax=Thalassomonas actiniarum TaxID=485447 RepID=A0AAE9YW20_9GAMM|nr:DUF3087 family protein [Thalassomonas actiniarum]WDE01414.1 DUF3087 family protein [Thalassomonas actiniarum]
MKLIEIDKSRYRQHLNRVIIGFIASLLALSLLFGAALIAAFGQSPALQKEGNISGQEQAFTAQNPQAEMPDNIRGQGADKPALDGEAVPESTGNFRYNLLGVILALLACAAVLHQLKGSRYFSEIYYVWQLKQLQNLIYRRLNKIKQAAGKGNVDALVILGFYYAGLKQVYLLDDNTLTLGKVEQDITALEKLAADNGVSLSPEQFSADLIKKF